MNEADREDATMQPASLAGPMTTKCDRKKRKRPYGKLDDDPDLQSDNPSICAHERATTKTQTPITSKLRLEGSNSFMIAKR